MQGEGLESAEPLPKGRLWTFAPPILHFKGRAVSPEAKALVAHCLTGIVLPSLTGQQQRPSSLPSIEHATEGTLAGLSLAKGRWLRRPMSDQSFVSEPGVTLAQFKKVLSAFVHAGLVDQEIGFQTWGGGKQTRLRLGAPGRELAKRLGVTLGNTELHFVSSD